MSIDWILFLMWILGSLLWLVSHHLGMTKVFLYKAISAGLFGNFVIPLVTKTAIINFRATNHPEVIDSFIVNLVLFYLLNIVFIIIGLLRRI